MEKNGNHLLDEKSLYLQQHAYNPVEWYPWCDEAFEKAKREKKPIFLSIGYSSCHWCHVMAHESFEDDQVADLMNDTLVSIKVDKEERPDINKVYMKIAQAMTGRGGWPLNILMTPEKKPFHAFTYLPKESRGGRMGLLDLLRRIKDLWNNRREELIAKSDEVITRLKNQSIEERELPTKKNLKKAFKRFSSSFDEKNGGFGSPPKFPSPHTLSFLLKYWKRTGNDRALQMVEKTLNAMRKGGIYDHLGFGFHRYSTDEKWKLPHFEKMLYDQALLPLSYIQAYQGTGKEKYALIAKETLQYVKKRMLAPENGFYSAEDADIEGEEGSYYVWSEQEIRDVLEEDADLFVTLFNVKEQGNYRDEATNKKTGKNILFMDQNKAEFAEKLEISQKQLETKLKAMRKQLLERRLERKQPSRDEKILTDRNGLMIKTLAKAGAVLGERNYTQLAKNAADFLLETMTYKDHQLFHSYIEGVQTAEGNLDDYAFFIWGLLELYQATFQIKYLREAISFTESMLTQFWDDKGRGFFFTPKAKRELPLQEKEVYDGSYPSGNSIAFLDLLLLSRITGRNDFKDRLQEMVSFFAEKVTSRPLHHAMFISGLEHYLGTSYEIVVVGERESKDTQLLLRVIREHFLPNKILLLKEKKRIEKLANFTSEMTKKEGKATVYVCHDYQCDAPLVDPSKLRNLLTDISS